VDHKAGFQASGLFEKPPEVSSQSFPQLIDCNHLTLSSRLMTHHVFLIYILVSNDISNFTASGGNLRSYGLVLQP